MLSSLALRSPDPHQPTSINYYFSQRSSSPNTTSRIQQDLFHLVTRTVQATMCMTIRKKYNCGHEIQPYFRKINCPSVDTGGKCTGSKSKTVYVGKDCDSCQKKSYD